VIYNAIRRTRDAMTDNEREMNKRKKRARSDGHLITKRDGTSICPTNQRNESHPPTFDSSPTRVVCVRRYCLRHHRLNLDVVVEVVAVAVLVVVVVVVVAVAAVVATGQPAHCQHHFH